jgi:hypothetical protein
MSDTYYDFNSIRKQVFLAREQGLCLFDIHPLDERQETIIKNEDWSAECKELCTKGWCTICLDVRIIGWRTRTVNIYYLPEAPIAYVKLFGTIFAELKQYKIINSNSLEQIKAEDTGLPESIS